MRDHFCGWYFKCQSSGGTLAVIPAYHRVHGKTSCLIQIITEKGSWNVNQPYERFEKSKKGFSINAGKNHFGEDGMELYINEEDVAAAGRVSFGALTPIRYDIMGPFRFVPFMECRHSIVSMFHTVNGEITVNGEKYVFKDGAGYIEGDRGYSFPKAYSWTQCFFDGGSLMLSVADIPFVTFGFTGIIGVVRIGENEYRIATYKGAKAEKIKDGELVIKQGKLRFTAKLSENIAHPLLAPVGGAMARTIRENASCRARYKLEKEGRVLLEFESNRASFEYEYPR
ncbi:MAG: hypothetical protein J5940_00530 [Clostridia bacterium]|nr:hypothetical protein [Clostridia bacterium]